MKVATDTSFLHYIPNLELVLGVSLRQNPFCGPLLLDGGNACQANQEEYDIWDQENTNCRNQPIGSVRNGELVVDLVDPLIGVTDIRTNLRMQRASLVIYHEIKRVERKLQALGAGGIRSIGGAREQRREEHATGTFSKRSPIMQFCSVRPVVPCPQTKPDDADEEEDEAFMIAKMLGSSFGGLDNDRREGNRQLVYHYIPQNFSVPSVGAPSKVIHAEIPAYTRDPDLFRPTSGADTAVSNVYGTCNRPNNVCMSPTTSVIQLCNDALTPAQQSNLLPPQPIPLMNQPQEAYMPPKKVRDSLSLIQENGAGPTEQKGLPSSSIYADEITVFSSLGSPGYVWDSHEKSDSCYEKRDSCYENIDSCYEKRGSSIYHGLPPSVFPTSNFKNQNPKEDEYVREEVEIFTLHTIHSLLDDTLNMTKR